MKIALAVFFLLPLTTFSQINFQKLSCPEKWWVVKHLFVAKKAKAISQEAREASKQMEKDSTLDGDADGGQVDAFRHSYWMARLAQEISWKKALKLGKAHEKGNYRSFLKNQYEELSVPDSSSTTMDIFNNRVGVSVGCNNKDLTTDALISLLKEKILAGEMKIISKDQLNHSLDCKGNVLDLDSFKGTWNIPRCLTSSKKLKMP